MLVTRADLESSTESLVGKGVLLVYVWWPKPLYGKGLPSLANLSILTTAFTTEIKARGRMTHKVREGIPATDRWVCAKRCVIGSCAFPWNSETKLCFVKAPDGRMAVDGRSSASNEKRCLTTKLYSAEVYVIVVLYYYTLLHTRKTAHLIKRWGPLNFLQLGINLN